MADLCLGTVQFGMKYGINNRQGQPSMNDSVEMIKYAVDNGVKYIDTARAYGDAELVIGEYNKIYGVPKDIKIISKLRPNIIEADTKDVNSLIRDEFESSLKRMGVDKLNGYLLHTPEYIYNQNILDALLNLKEEKMVENIKQWNNIQIEGTFSHFSLAFFGNGKEAQEQFSRFIDCVAVLKKEKIDTGMLHICNSSAFLRFTNMYLNAVRIGSALLGRLSIPNTWGFQRVGILKSNVAEIKTLPKGYNIGYSNSYQTKKETKVAVVPCGYADGFNVIVDKDMFRKRDKIRYIVRDIKNAFKQQQIFVKINGEKFKVLGRLGMFHVTVDITGKNINIGDEVMFEVSPMLVDSKIERKYI